MTIRCTRMKGRDLKPGDLFSTRGQGYWDVIDLFESVGESVYIRTRTPAGRFPDADADIYRIEIEPGEEAAL